ncbi:hypothetical protein [Floridanema evergladense]|uniref:Uncharacterized protein n=1 Tax=Floridaenema evergladense BLCC-F167 TaxID=3153639 RepID=A0ABV4WCV5_9CYAN
MSVEQFAETIKTDSRLTPGQKNQCLLFLHNYGKEGIAISKRYIAICLGETVVLATNTYPWVWETMRNLLIVSPGMTVLEIAQRLNLKACTVADRLSKAYRRGKINREGTKREGYRYYI